MTPVVVGDQGIALPALFDLSSRIDDALVGRDHELVCRDCHHAIWQALHRALEEFASVDVDQLRRDVLAMRVADSLDERARSASECLSSSDAELLELTEWARRFRAFARERLPDRWPAPFAESLSPFPGVWFWDHDGLRLKRHFHDPQRPEIDQLTAAIAACDPDRFAGGAIDENDVASIELFNAEEPGRLDQNDLVRRGQSCPE